MTSIAVMFRLKLAISYPSDGGDIRVECCRPPGRAARTVNSDHRRAPSIEKKPRWLARGLRTGRGVARKSRLANTVPTGGNFAPIHNAP